MAVRRIDISLAHDNSSTIKADPRLSAVNGNTFLNNREYFEGKVLREDFGEGGWVLDRRRANRWD